MLVPPVAMFAYPHVAHGNPSPVMYYRYGEALCAFLCGYYGAAAVCLLYERFIGCHKQRAAAVQFRIKRYWCQIKRV
jgi:hypothetical protein